MYHLLLAFWNLAENWVIMQEIVIPMYNLVECSKYHSKTSGSLWNYLRDEPKAKQQKLQKQAI